MRCALHCNEYRADRNLAMQTPLELAEIRVGPNLCASVRIFKMRFKGAVCSPSMIFVFLYTEKAASPRLPVLHFYLEPRDINKGILDKINDPEKQTKTKNFTSQNFL